MTSDLRAVEHQAVEPERDTRAHSRLLLIERSMSFRSEAITRGFSKMGKLCAAEPIVLAEKGGLVRHWSNKPRSVLLLLVMPGAPLIVSCSVRSDALCS